MFVVVDLTPIDDGLKPSSILLHPKLRSYHLDDFSLPISFPVNAQPQLRIQDAEPVIYCRHSRCDVLHNGTPATKTIRRVNTGDNIRIRSSDDPETVFVTYAVRVAYLSFSSDSQVEAGLDKRRVELGAALALSEHTTARFPLNLPLDGKLPVPAPAGTNWNGVRDLIDDVRERSAQIALLRQEQQQQHHVSPASSGPDRTPSMESRTYAEIIAQSACPPTSLESTSSPRDEAALNSPPSSRSGTSPLTSVLPINSTFAPPEVTSSALAPTSVSTTPSGSLPSPSSTTPTSLPTSVFTSPSRTFPPTSQSAASSSSNSVPTSHPPSGAADTTAESVAGIAASPVSIRASSAVPLHSSSVRVDTLSVALHRVREAWMTARREILTSISPSFFRWPALPYSHFKLSTAVRVGLIDRVQADLLAIRADLFPISRPSRTGSDSAHAHCGSAAPLVVASPASAASHVPFDAIPAPHVLPCFGSEVTSSSAIGLPTFTAPVSCFRPIPPACVRLPRPGLPLPHLPSTSWMSPSSALVTSYIKHLIDDFASFCDRLPFGFRLPPPCDFVSPFP
ncbi:hypothetical protein CF326_g8448 [Tilletia indica]|nr:hypothetical protein CF326_g8448 [Tilletia indica]